MSRQARQYSQSGFYHVIYRGMNRQNIFEVESDYAKKIDIISFLKQEMGFKIHAYCLMTNHVHLLLKENKIGDISLIMKRLLVTYAGWFNKKYSRSGALIANRYKSRVPENDSDILSVIRYIHQNPKKSNMVQMLSEYKWSSYNEYLKKSGLADTQFVLSLLGGKEGFIEFHSIDEGVDYIVTDRKSKSEEEIRNRIIAVMEGKDPHEIGQMPKEERNKIILRLRETERFSIRQIERATGISRGVIARIK